MIRVAQKGCPAAASRFFLAAGPMDDLDLSSVSSPIRIPRRSPPPDDWDTPPLALWDCSFCGAYRADAATLDPAACPAGHRACRRCTARRVRAAPCAACAWGGGGAGAGAGR